MQHNQKAMQDALRNKKAQGLDVTIVLGGHDEGPDADDFDAEGKDPKAEARTLGLAPDAERVNEEENGGQDGHYDGQVPPGHQPTPHEELEENSDNHDAKGIMQNKAGEAHITPHPAAMNAKDVVHHELSKMGRGSMARRAMKEVK